MKDGFRPYLPLAFVIGLGFFTMGLMDPLYDTYLPIFLGKWIPSMGVVGAVMTLDNAFAVLLIPLVSVWSDRTRTPIGRRMPGGIGFTCPIPAQTMAVIKVTHTNPAGKISMIMPQWYRRGVA